MTYLSKHHKLYDPGHQGDHQHAALLLPQHHLQTTLEEFLGGALVGFEAAADGWEDCLFEVNPSKLSNLEMGGEPG